MIKPSAFKSYISWGFQRTVHHSTSEKSEVMEEGQCEVCDLSGQIPCGNCFKVVYCGVSHLSLDKDIHSKDCFPAAIRISSTKGRYMEAKRDIRGGELVLVEKPLIVLPRMGSFSRKAQYTCLGCHGYIPGSNTSTALPKINKCSKCTWPVCSSFCERVW